MKRPLPGRQGALYQPVRRAYAFTFTRSEV